MSEVAGSEGGGNGIGGHDAPDRPAGHCDDKRRQLSARVCVESALGLGEMCRLHGLTASGFLDALGHILGDLASMSDAEMAEVAPTIAFAVRIGRDIDHDRRGGGRP